MRRNIPLIALVLPMLACRNQTSAAGPLVVVDVSGYLEGYPIAMGAKVKFGTSWSGECQEGGHGVPLPGLNKAEPRHVVCDEKTYTARIHCEGGGNPKRPACRIHTPNLPDALDRVVREELRGSVEHEVEIFGDRPVHITVIVERDGRRSVHHLPRLYPLAIKEFDVECEGARDNGFRSCESDPFPAGSMVKVNVRSATNKEPFYVRTRSLKVNGHAQEDDKWFSLKNVLPDDGTMGAAVPAGDYKIVVEVNPPPYTIRKELTVRVR